MSSTRACEICSFAFLSLMLSLIILMCCRQVLGSVMRVCAESSGSATFCLHSMKPGM